MHFCKGIFQRLVSSHPFFEINDAFVVSSISSSEWKQHLHDFFRLKSNQNSHTARLGK